MNTTSKITLTLSFFSFVTFAQNPNGAGNANTQWKINGNTASSTDFMGTTNNQSLIFKTNNIERAKIGLLGDVIINEGGFFRPLPSNPIAAYMLKVGGSGAFEGELNSRNLFVQEYITYMKSLKGPRIDVDTIRMDSTRGIFGKTKIFGDVNIKQDLLVEGTTTLRNNLITEKGFTFDGTNGFSYIPSNGSSPKIFQYGNKVSGIGTNCAAGPQSWANHQFGGILQIYDYNNPTSSGLLNLQTWAGGSSIDASVGGQTVAGGLLLNYFCGNNTFINTGQYGGIVSMGKIVEIGMPINDITTALHIKANTGQSNGIVLRDANNARNFVVKSDGYVYARAIEISVNNFPDYVFSKDYKLKDISEIESFINKNNHLEGFKSAKEYESNGLSVGEIIKLQQEKIEELTLYLIEQNKRINLLEKKVGN